MTLRYAVVAMSMVIALACRTAALEPLPTFEPSQLVAHAETLRVRRSGDSVGVAIVQLQVLPDSVLSLVATGNNDSVTQEVVMTFDRVSLKPRRVRASEPLELVDLAYGADGVRGKRVVWNPAGAQDTIEVNAAIDSGTLDRRHLLPIIPWLSLAHDRSFGVKIFDSWLFPAVLYVSIDSPRAILRIERPNQGVISELISCRAITGQSSTATSC